jgi:hypothetical protein
MRARFSPLLADADALDYVDHTKSLDSRVRVPPFSQSLVSPLAVLFAPDDARARSGAVGSHAVQSWYERAETGAGAGVFDGTARGGVLGERAGEGARAGGASRRCS